MRCDKCGNENREGRRFCAECGAALAVACAHCGASNEPGEKFCGQCGGALEVVVRTSEPERLGVQPRDAGERRHLTVLFCDLVGSTQIAAQLDPEEWRETVAAYHRAAAEAITSFGGHVAKYLGDGAIAFFGYPQAHDNDAERAARAGLAILEAIAKLNEQPGRPRLAARVGIHSGAAVVGAGAGPEADIFGETPNIAARVQEAAAPGTVAVTEDTHRLIPGLFVVEAMGAPALKGVARPIQLYRIVQPSGVRGRFEAAAAARGLTPFVGREDELRLLMNRWARAQDGEGQVVLIIGEAGIGKSRFIHRVHEQLGGTPHAWIEAAAAPLFQNTPFYPVAGMLKQALAWRGEESAQQQLTQLESALELAGLKPGEVLPLIAPLLDLPVPAKYPPVAFSPDQQRRRLLAALVEMALGTATVQPTLIAIEDLHWADPSTLELIQLLVEQGATARLLLVLTARPEFHAPWPPRAHHTQITLNRLSPRNVFTMVREVAARTALPEETIAAVVERTGGVPLFVEELTRAVLESGDTKAGGHDIPATLHDSLMARLDRLGPAKEVLQVGAVIGGEFTYDLLHAVHPIAEADLQHTLRALADAELLYVRGIAPESSYQFKHALIRDAAYEALLKSRRKELHRQVAHTLDEKFSALKEAHPEVLAHHWTEAGETEPAIAQWSQAGKGAQERNAFKEAQESYQQALALLNLLPQSPERDRRELELRQSVVSVLHMVRGFAAPETIEATGHAAALAEKSGNLTQLFTSVGSKFLNVLFSGDIPSALALADQALEFGRRLGGPTVLGSAHLNQTIVHYYHGDFAGAEEHFAATSNFFDDPTFRQNGGTVAALAWASLNAWYLGRFDLARERARQMLAAVNDTNPWQLAISSMFHTHLQFRLREYEQAEALAERSIGVSEKNQFPLSTAFSRFILGGARAQLGRASEGIALIRQATPDLLKTGRMVLPLVIGELALVQGREGAIAEALETVEQALQVNPGMTMYRPEELRVRGELRRMQEKMELTEADFRESVALAREMGAKVLELRAAMSLARLLQEQGKIDEARKVLSEIYNWFTEGFDIADLKDAKALLDELGA